MKESVANRIVSGLKGFADALKDDEPITDRFTCRKIILDLEPTTYGANEVKATRKLLRASQVIFAKFLGVSPKTVRSWEQGVAVPKDIACRFMDEIQRNPEYWRDRLRDSVKVKEPC